MADWVGRASLFDADMQAALAYTDAMTREVQVPAEIWRSVRARFSEREALELTVLVGSYNMVSRVLTALELE